MYTPEQRRTYNRERYQRLKKEKGTAGVKRGRPRMVVLAARVPETWIAQMQRMANEAIATGNGPWKTTQEVMRALLAEGFEAMKDRDQMTGEFMPLLEMQQQLADVDRARTTAQQMLAMAKQNVQAMLDIHQENAAIQYFHSALLSAEKLPPTVWSDWLVRELRKTFPRLSKLHDVNKIPGVPLGTTYAARAAMKTKQQTTKQKRVAR